MKETDIISVDRFEKELIFVINHINNCFDIVIPTNMSFFARDDDSLIDMFNCKNVIIKKKLRNHYKVELAEIVARINLEMASGKNIYWPDFYIPYYSKRKTYVFINWGYPITYKQQEAQEANVIPKERISYKYPSNGPLRIPSRFMCFVKYLKGLFFKNG